MTNYIKFISTFLLSILLAGCASGPTFSGLAPTNVHSSNVYIYKPSGLSGSAGAFPVYFDGKDIGSISNGTYILVKTTPGKHLVQSRVQGTFLGSSFMSSNDRYSLNIMVPANRNIFVLLGKKSAGYTMSAGGLMPIYTTKLIQVSNQEGMQGLIGLTELRN